MTAPTGNIAGRAISGIASALRPEIQAIDHCRGERGRMEEKDEQLRRATPDVRDPVINSRQHQIDDQPHSGPAEQDKPPHRGEANRSPQSMKEPTGKRAFRPAPADRANQKDPPGDRMAENFDRIHARKLTRPSSFAITRRARDCKAPLASACRVAPSIQVEWSGRPPGFRFPHADRMDNKKPGPDAEATGPGFECAGSPIRRSPPRGSPASPQGC